MLWFHLFTEIKQQRNHLFLWSPMEFAFGIAGKFSQGHWVGPDGFDFRRHAYFQSLGGVGFARKGFEQLYLPHEHQFWKDHQRN